MASHHLLEERVLRDLVELYELPTFRRVCEALTARRDALRQATEDEIGGDAVHKLRGASGELHELLRYFTAPDRAYADMRTRAMRQKSAAAGAAHV